MARLGRPAARGLVDHDWVTIDAEHTKGSLHVDPAKCYGQTDLYKGSQKFDGIDGALPHYPDSTTPTA